MVEGNENWLDLMNKEIVGNLGGIKLPKRNIILFSGQSMAGKTVSCLHFTKSGIEMGKKVLYFDTEEKSIISRAEPNLFNKFFSENPEGFKKLFHYRNNLDNWVKDIIEIKPDMVVIDSLYQPFLDKEPEARTRARLIKEFLTEFRGVIWEQNIGAVITVPTGRIVDEGVVKLVPLGGEGVKYLADVKVLIHFSGKEDNDSKVGENRLFVVDRNLTYQFEIEAGGILTQK